MARTVVREISALIGSHTHDLARDLLARGSVQKHAKAYDACWQRTDGFLACLPAQLGSLTGLSARIRPLRAHLSYQTSSVRSILANAKAVNARVAFLRSPR